VRSQGGLGQGAAGRSQGAPRVKTALSLCLSSFYLCNGVVFIVLCRVSGLGSYGILSMCVIETCKVANIVSY
jgi:hypothetical protein